MVKKSSGQSKQATLFEVRFNNLDHDVLLLKGHESEASSALVEGKIVLSLKEAIAVKRVSLKLTAKMQLKWTEDFPLSRGGTTPRPINFERRIFEHNWDSNELTAKLAEYAESTMSQYGSLRKNHSSTSLTSASFRSLSSTSLASKAGSAKSSYTNLAGLGKSNGSLKFDLTLGPGNYEIPFSAILPGNMPESVIGLPGGSVIYRFEAMIDRGKFHNSMTSNRHLRVVRTLGADAYELSETVAVDNTWPEKVEYSLNVPSKAIAIGSNAQLSFLFVPLLKGLKLGAISIQFVELYSYADNFRSGLNEERVVAKKHLPAPQNDENEILDKWEVETTIKVPPSLSKCTQDCDVPNHLKVRHKIKVSIGLVNPDGHVSELRASLPVQLYISPFVTIGAKTDSAENSDASEAEEDDDLLFPQDNLLLASDFLTSDSNALSGMVAPPVYERHIFDRLWSNVSPHDSPINSGISTPRYTGEDQLHMSNIDCTQLTENLRQLYLQRDGESGNDSHVGTPALREPFPERPSFNIEDDGNDTGDYFSNHNVVNPIPLSPGMVSPPVHMSRENSNSSLLDSDNLSKVPSYLMAVKSPAKENALAPAYEPPLPESNINMDEANKNFERTISTDDFHRKEGRLSRGHSSTDLNKSFPPSSASSLSSMQMPSISPLPPSITRGSSKGNLNSRSSSGIFERHQNDKSNSGDSRSPELNSIVSSNGSKTDHASRPFYKKMHSSANLKPSHAAERVVPAGTPFRSSSNLNLHNLQFLHKKRDKK